MPISNIIPNAKALIAMRTDPANRPELNRALDYVKGQLKDLTVECFERSGATSILAYRGDVRPEKFKIILNGHLDVIPGKDWQYEARVEGDRMYGVGSMDMKTNDCVMLEVFRDMAGKVPYPLGLQIVTDEEIMGFISESSFGKSLVWGNSECMISFCSEYAKYISQLRSRSARSVLSDVEKDIREHYAENISLRELSRKYYINNAYLGQLFKKKFGVSFKDYLTDYRIKEAARMLLATDKKVINIAEDVGYKDSDYFVQKFIERIGCTPSKYRSSNGAAGEQ